MSKSKLRLGPLPSNTSVKLTFTCPASLKTELNRYAALHAQFYGEPVDVAALIPHMLQAFMARHRGFRGRRTNDADQPRALRSRRSHLPRQLQAGQSYSRTTVWTAASIRTSHSTGCARHGRCI